MRRAADALEEGAAWVGVGFCRSPAREIDGRLSGANGGVLQLWYPTDEDWRSLLPDLDLQPDSLVSFELFGHGGSCAHGLLTKPLIERILAMASTKHAALAVRCTGDVEEDIMGR